VGAVLQPVPPGLGIGDQSISARDRPVIASGTAATINPHDKLLRKLPKCLPRCMLFCLE